MKSQDLVIVLLLILSQLTLLPKLYAKKNSSVDTIKYCVPIKKIDLNPFREIKDGKELAYLLLLKSYISNDSTETGILSAYEMSPDGKLFTGKIYDNLTWPDGSKFTPKDAAFGIAKALPFRALGQRIRIVGAEKVNLEGWEDRIYKGIEILNDTTFRLKLESDVQNITGVFREALTTNSRHNRFWPAKAGKKGWQVLSKFPQLQTSAAFQFEVFGKTVSVTDDSNCNEVNFSIFLEALNLKTKSYDFKKSPVTSAISLQPNSMKLGLADRNVLSQIIRTAFEEAAKRNPNLGIISVKSFFQEGESGFERTRSWQYLTNSSKASAKRKWTIACESPIFKSVLRDYFIEHKIEAKLIDIPFESNDIDAQLLASGIQDGRHIVFQDLLNWPHVLAFFGANKKTIESLKVIAAKSASTLPPDSSTLGEFENHALGEVSFVPVARRTPLAYTDSKLPFVLAWTQKGELTFVQRTPQN